MNMRKEPVVMSEVKGEIVDESFMISAPLSASREGEKPDFAVLGRSLNETKCLVANSS